MKTGNYWLDRIEKESVQEINYGVKFLGFETSSEIVFDFGLHREDELRHKMAAAINAEIDSWCADIIKDKDENR